MCFLIKASRLCKKFHVGSTELSALDSVDLSLDRGEFVAIMGPSGSGKTTLMYILGCLERPTSGSYSLEGIDVINASDWELSHIRANRIGFVFQTFNLLPHLNVYENIELPFLYRSLDETHIHQKIMNSIEQVGLKMRIKHRPSELSGGEMQRVAIARAICTSPVLILADEPTGNLDSHTGQDILNIFKQLHEGGATIIMVTHDQEVASIADRTMFIKDGIFLEEPSLA